MLSAILCACHPLYCVTAQYVVLVHHGMHCDSNLVSSAIHTIHFEITISPVSCVTIERVVNKSVKWDIQMV